MSDYPLLGVTLPTDIAEPRQWRQARLDALNTLEQQAQGCIYKLGSVEVFICLKSHARSVIHPMWMPERPRRRIPTAAKVPRYWAERRPGVFKVNPLIPACFRCGLRVKHGVALTALIWLTGVAAVWITRPISRCNAGSATG
jgi:hypothetical protein